MTTNQRAGLLLIGVSLLTGLAMLHHPNGSDILSNAASGGTNGADRAVHWIAIFAEALLLVGTTALARQLNGEHELSVSAWIFFALGMMSLIAAAIASGLIAPSIAQHVAATSGGTQEQWLAFFRYTHEINEGFAAVGFSLMSVGILTWSVAMIRLRFSVPLGLLGIIVGLFTTVSFVFDAVPMHLHGFGGAMMAGQLLWLSWSGALLWRAAVRLQP